MDKTLKFSDRELEAINKTLDEDIADAQEVIEQLEQKIRTLTERNGSLQAWIKTLLSILQKGDPERFRGWYWHLEQECPVFVTGLANEGFSGTIIRPSLRLEGFDMVHGYFLLSDLVRMKDLAEFDL